MNKKIIVEIVQFKLTEGVSEEAFIQDAENVQKNFLEKQLGYAGSRQLLKGKDGEGTDIVYWESLEHAENAQKAAMESLTCMPMFQKINPESIKIKVEI